ncbi:MAG: GNAT family N-acetyltransferase [Chitinophagaceae bacterium]
MQYTDGLESARLVTRFVTMADTTAWLEYYEDPQATAYTAIPGMTATEMTRHVLHHTLLRYSDGRMGLQALLCKESRELVGMCGLMVQELNGVPEVEIGYHLLHKHWGKGYATEAAQLFRDYGFRNGAASLVSIIHPGNIASQKVAIRNGMQIDPSITVFKGQQRMVFRITKEEWAALQA